MPQQDFNAAEMQAIQRAREMYSRASPRPDAKEPVFRKQPNPPPQAPLPPPKREPPPPPKREQSPFGFSQLGKGFDGDMKLIIAMMLLLSSDGGDTLLLMALLYIML